MARSRDESVKPLPRRPAFWAGAAALFAAAVRVAYFLFARAGDPLFRYLIHDARVYHRWAAGLASGGSGPPGVFYQAPLYPYLLSLVYRVAGPRPGAAFVVQMALGIATVFLTWRIARRARGPVAGAAAAWISALYGIYAFYEIRLLPTALSVFLAALLVDRFQSADRKPGNAGWLAAGLVQGAAALARPNLLLAAPLAAAWILSDRSRPGRGRLARLALFAAGALIVVAPVTFRNLRAGGEFVLVSANGGITFYQGNNPAARGIFSTPEGFTGSIRTQRTESRRLAEQAAGRPLTDEEVSRFWFRKGLRYLASHPARAAGLLGRKLYLLVDNYEHALVYNPQLDRNPARWAAPLPFALILALVAVRAVAGGRMRREETPLLLVAGSVAATLVIFFVAGRYRLPAMPALIALAGCGLGALHESGFSRRLLLPAAVAGAVALVSAARPPLPGAGIRAVEEATGWCDIGEALLSAGRTGESVTAYEEGTRLDPSYPYAWLDLGKALRAAKRDAEAERAIQEAVRRAPALAEAWSDLGVLLYETGRPGEAADAFARALALDPGDAPTANNLLGSCLRAGRWEQAMVVWKAMERRGVPVDAPLDSYVRRRLGSPHPGHAEGPR